MLMDIHQIIKKLPHRYPFLLVDRVLELEKDVRIKALKNVTINEPFFNGHFPNRPVMPGVLMLEALAQASALLSFSSEGEESDGSRLYYFAGIDGARFKRVVEPGDQLILESTIDAQEGRHLQVRDARHRGRRAGRRGELMCTVRAVAAS
jgi:3-hydroxyacyl-[acyl-carrier-protein] dehydratase